MPTLGYIGEKVDLLVRQGATLGPFTVTLLNPDGSATDLTGVSIRGQIRKHAFDSIKVAELQVHVVDASAGKFEFGLDDATTSSIETGESIRDEDSVYLWDMEMKDAAGRVTPLYWGDCKVFRRITRE